MNTYVVIGEENSIGAVVNSVLYVGNSEEKAKNFKVDLGFRKLRLEVWKNEIKINEYICNYADWEETYDLIEKLNGKIEYHEKQLESYKKKLESVN